MALLLQSPAGSPERQVEIEEIELLRDKTLDSQMGFYNLCDRLVVLPEFHPKLREQQRFKDLNDPYRRNGYISSKTVGSLIKSRWENEDLNHDEWVQTYTKTTLTYTSLIFLTRRVCSELGYRSTPRNLNFILNTLWVRIFTQTEEGFQREKTVHDLLIETDGECRHATEEEERESHLDFVTPLAAYQVKTPHFLRRATTAGHRKDQNLNFSAQWRWSAENGKPVIYVVQYGDRYARIPLADAVRRCKL